MEHALHLENLASELLCLATNSPYLHFLCLMLCSVFYTDTTDAIIYIYTHTYNCKYIFKVNTYFFVKFLCKRRKLEIYFFRSNKLSIFFIFLFFVLIFPGI